MSSALPLGGELEVAVDGLGVVFGRRHAPKATRARPSADGEIPGGGDRQVAHPAAAHIGGVGAADPVAVGQQLRGVHRAADHDGAARRQRAGGAQQRRIGIAGARRRSGWDRARRPRPRPASVRPSAARVPAPVSPSDNVAAAADRVPVGPRRGHQMRRGEQGLGDRRGARRGGAVQRVGGPHQQLLGVVGGVEPPARPLGVGEVRQRGVEQAGGGVQPRLSRR